MMALCLLASYARTVFGEHAGLTQKLPQNLITEVVISQSTGQLFLTVVKWPLTLPHSKLSLRVTCHIIVVITGGGLVSSWFVVMLIF